MKIAKLTLFLALSLAACDETGTDEMGTDETGTDETSTDETGEICIHEVVVDSDTGGTVSFGPLDLEGEVRLELHASYADFRIVAAALSRGEDTRVLWDAAPTPSPVAAHVIDIAIDDEGESLFLEAEEATKVQGHFHGVDPLDFDEDGEWDLSFVTPPGMGKIEILKVCLSGSV